MTIRFKTVRRNFHVNAAYVEEIHMVFGGSGDEIVIGQNKEITVTKFYHFHFLVAIVWKSVLTR